MFQLLWKKYETWNLEQEIENSISTNIFPPIPRSIEETESIDTNLVKWTDCSEGGLERRRDPMKMSNRRRSYGQGKGHQLWSRSGDQLGLARPPNSCTKFYKTLVYFYLICLKKKKSDDILTISSRHKIVTLMNIPT